ncbi:MAG: flippase-like domain-containing protein [Candidatus Latescibacteria bacterium]|nr:flippase-like domain-containing protein [Candidatus Latescibacterota bacterium]
MNTHIKKLSLPLKIIAVLTVIFFITKMVIKDWKAIQSFNWHINPLYLMVSFLGFCCGYAFLVWIWSVVLKALGYTVPYSEAWNIYFIGNLGRYIPGKLWTIAGIAYMAGKSGIPGVVAGTSAICAQAYSILSSFVFLILFLIFKGTYDGRFQVLWALPLLIVLVPVFMMPRNLEWSLNFLLKKMGRSQISIKYKTPTAIRITFLYLCSWFIFGGSFRLFISAVTGSTTINPLYLTGTYAVAYILGYIAFFAPGGIGVRESILTVLLTGYVPAGVAAVLSVSLRLMITFVEIACVVPVLFGKGLLHYGKEKTTTNG